MSPYVWRIWSVSRDISVATQAPAILFSRIFKEGLELVMIKNLNTSSTTDYAEKYLYSSFFISIQVLLCVTSCLFLRFCLLQRRKLLKLENTKVTKHSLHFFYSVWFAIPYYWETHTRTPKSQMLMIVMYIVITAFGIFFIWDTVTPLCSSSV